MYNIDNDLAFVINIHQRLVRDFPKTPYNSWCAWVHSQSFSPEEKWARILQWQITPQDYENPTLFAADWQLNKLLSKFSSGGTPSEEEKDVAYRKFQDAEELCQRTNAYYRSGYKGQGVEELLSHVKNSVSQVLGDISDFFAYVETYEYNSPLIRNCHGEVFPDIDEIAETPNVSPEFGPGVSVSSRSEKGKPERLGTIPEKLLTGSVTASCAYIGNWLSRLWNIPHSKITRGSVLTFVLKKVGEARTICYEPSMNMLIQKLLGRYLKHRLKVVWGIDLSKQQRNRITARLGSLCDSWATADQSSASDLFAYQYVMEALPFPWFKFMDDIRSKEYFDPVSNCWKQFNKFSTMGNGFTFELETLLFAAIVRSAVWCFHGHKLMNRDLIVYGDDLIFPKEYADTIEQALLVSGHLPNRSKTFKHGPFRESCGGDYFKGWNVTPFKIKELQLENPKSVVNVYNGLIAVSSSVLDHQCVSSWFSRACLFIKRWLREHYPRLADGPVEIAYDEKLLEFTANPSNRWLWSINDTDTVNNVWCRFSQCIVPKYILREVEVVSQDFCLPDGVIGYISENGGENSRTSTLDFRFVRNPILKVKGPVQPRSSGKERSYPYIR